MSKKIGRRKLEMVKMQNDKSRQVTFSKRRTGVFKKASELCTLCGAQVGIVVFSPSNKPFSFGHPDIGAVIDRYLNRDPPERSAGQNIEAHRNANICELNSQLTQLLTQLEIEKDRGEELKEIQKARQNEYWWEAPIDELSLAQLLQLKSAMEEMKINVAKQAEKLFIQRANSYQFSIGASSSVGGFHNHNPNMMP